MTSAISSPIKLSRRAKALLLSPVVVLIAAATRLIVISNGDTTVASSVAAAGGVTGSLLGTVIPLLPPYLPFLVLVFVLTRRVVLASLIAFAAALVSPAYSSETEGWNYAVGAIPELWGHLLRGEWSDLLPDGPLVACCLVLAIVFAFWGISEVAPDEQVRTRKHFSQFRFVIFGVVCGALCTLGLLFMLKVYRVPFDVDFASQTARRPWLPAEEIQTDDGGKYVGFVISTKDGWFLLMNEQDRSLLYIKADSVESRVVCVPRSYRVEYKAPLIELRGTGNPQGRVCGRPSSR